MEWIEIFWIVLGGFLLFLGFIGCFLPILPGPPLSYCALLIMHFFTQFTFETDFLMFWLMVTLIVTAADYLVPVIGTKKMGGSKYGTWGSSIGLILGIIFFPPLGIIIGPIIGALLGELLTGRTTDVAIKSALGSFLGFLFGTLIKLIASGFMSYYFAEKLIAAL